MRAGWTLMLPLLALVSIGMGCSDASAPANAGRDSPGKLEIPPDTRLQVLIKKTLLDFNSAVRAGDVTEFHNQTAPVWRNKTTPDQMRDAFNAFIEKKDHVNLETISDVEATLDPAPEVRKISGIDALILKGFYPTAPKRVVFELRYAQ